jgi:cytoskeleton protein RodZ
MDAHTSTSLSSTLRDARVAKGLELSDISEITHVRKEYLQALEEGRYGDLPEDIYARNFLRLYAQAVGLDDAKILERFSRERRAALGISTVSEAVSNGVRDVSTTRRSPAAVWLPVLILLGAVGGIGYFYFRNAGPLQPATVGASVTEETTVTGAAESTTTDTTTASDAVTESSSLEASTTDSVAAYAAGSEATTTTEAPATATAETQTADTATAENTAAENIATTTTTTVPDGATTTPTDLTNSVRFSLVTNPPGAEATLDNYPFPTRTPFFNAPVTPRQARVLRITLEGYQPYEELLDIEEETSKAVTLVPIGAAEAAVLGATPATEQATTPAQGQATGQGQLGITIEAETWLEVYQSTVRGEGERLVYSTVPTGQTYSFNLPVYVHVGNASGVRLTQDGQDLGLLGSSGEVTGRAFGQPLPPAPEPTPAPTPAEPEPTDPAAEGPQ